MILAINWTLHIYLSLFLICTILLLGKYYFEKQYIKISREWWFKYVFAALILLIVLTYIDISVKYFSEKPLLPEGASNILAELHGFALDLIIVTLILEGFRRKEEKRETIAELLNELEEYKDWNTEESTIRKIRIIKALLNRGRHPVSLEWHSFIKGNFKGINYNDLELLHCDFKETSFSSGEFTDKSLNFLNFHSSSLNKVKFIKNSFLSWKCEETSFTDCEFHDCMIRPTCEFKKCFFVGTKFRNTKFASCSFANSIVYGNFSFEGCDFDDADLEGVFFPHHRRNEIKELFKNWIGEKKAQDQIFDKFHLRNLDDPDPWDITHLLYPFAQRVKKENGCFFVKLEQPLNPYAPPE